jgi:AhpD family alkylhydroperoxidase
MEPRMTNPAALLPGAMSAINDLIKAAFQSGAPHAVMELVHLRASQVNGCSPCVVAGVESARKAGESEERLAAVAAWRHAPYFSDAERAALALAESMTRMSDRDDSVPDDIWNAVADNYSEGHVAGLVLWISITNLFNRLNGSTGQVAGAAW